MRGHPGTIAGRRTNAIPQGAGSQQSAFEVGGSCQITNDRPSSENGILIGWIFVLFTRDAYNEPQDRDPVLR